MELEMKEREAWKVKVFAMDVQNLVNAMLGCKYRGNCPGHPTGNFCQDAHNLVNG